jgi:hypothetical protein
MNNFCLIAFIPCIILAVWLLVELKKYLVVSKKLKSVEKSWNKIQAQKSSNYEDDSDDFVQSIPPPPPKSRSYYGEDIYSTNNHNDSTPGHDYEDNYYSKEHPRMKTKRQRRRQRSTYEDYPEYNDYASTQYDRKEHEVKRKSKRGLRDIEKKYERPQRRRRRRIIPSSKKQMKKETTDKTMAHYDNDEEQDVDWD